ncbi:uncharacterized protein METZ01_LOCUS355049 [marine metagenome]|uniref:Uncharacterized protein n=1 Tax=marine metagenome TaxID=408172 RepID=A0A382RYF5_9ZZZZ
MSESELLYLIHIVFITACVFFSYKSGTKEGRSQMVESFLDKKIITEERLKKEYDIEQ